MAKQTRFEMQIEATLNRIKNEQTRLKELGVEQRKADKKAREHRLCKRHGHIESILPDLITLTDEQVYEFTKKHIANRQKKKIIAEYVAENAKRTAEQAAAEALAEAERLAAEMAEQAEESEETALADTTADVDEKPQNSSTPAPTVAGQNGKGNTPTPNGQNHGNNSNQQSKQSTPNSTNPATMQGTQA
jgi:hypothetical protein